MSLFHRHVLIAVFTAGCAASPARDASDPRTRVIPGFASPESVAASGSRRFVSNIGAKLAPLEKDGDGFISELDEAGNVVALRAYAPLDAPKGMAVAGDILYVADIDRVIGFDLASHARVVEVTAPKGSVLLNDIAVEDDENLLVTDTFASRVYRMRLADRSMTQIADGIPGANGIVVDRANRTAYVAGIGPDLSGGDLFAIALTPSAGPPRRLGTAHGLFDGIAILSSGGLAVSDWVSTTTPAAGTLTVYSVSGTKERTLTLPEAIHGPADFFYDRAREEIWIPRTLDGSVSIVAAH
jgi:hypothetical protein